MHNNSIPGKKKRKEKGVALKDSRGGSLHAEIPVTESKKKSGVRHVKKTSTNHHTTVLSHTEKKEPNRIDGKKIKTYYGPRRE